MDRREFNRWLGVAASVPWLANHASAMSQDRGGNLTAADPDSNQKKPAGDPVRIGMLLYPGMYALDLVGPHAMLAGIPEVETYLLWKGLQAIPTHYGMNLVPTLTLANCPKKLDVLFVPGGTPGTIAMMQDNEVLDFLADRGKSARYVTSVCTGSLILGAAGLLQGYRATSHWHKRDLLPLFGAIPQESRIVEDRNRITGGGVTSGIDFGLVLASRLFGGDEAKVQQLVNEYDPHPPFSAGTPAQAGQVITARANQILAQGYEQTRVVALAARKRLGLS